MSLAQKEWSPISIHDVVLAWLRAERHTVKSSIAACGSSRMVGTQVLSALTSPRRGAIPTITHTSREICEMPRGHKHTPETLAKIAEASRRKQAAEAHEREPRPPDDILDQDMRPDDLVFVLENLRFQGSDRLGTLKVDRGVRDYLLTAVRRRHQPAST
jgi:hypothetical protein